MSENNQKVIKYDLIKEIKTEYKQEIVNWLKDNHYNYKVCEYKDFTPYETKEQTEEVFPLIEVEKESYEKLNKLSEITGIPVKNIASKELGDFFNSVGDYPENFLDRHLGIENIEDPIGMLHKMKDLINIPEKYLKSLKTKEDLIKEVENWYKPFKRPK